MNSDINKFLDEVDKWKFKLHEKLKKMTKEEETAFWAQALEKARALGLPIVDTDLAEKRKARRFRRATG